MERHQILQADGRDGGLQDDEGRLPERSPSVILSEAKDLG
jgi:hypothetical protein